MTEAIILAAIQVQRFIGPGMVEEVYEVCLAHGLRLDGHEVLREAYLDLTCEGLYVPSASKMGLLVDDKVGVEAKASSICPTPASPNGMPIGRSPALEAGRRLNFHNGPLKDDGIRRVVHTRT